MWERLMGGDEDDWWVWGMVVGVGLLLTLIGGVTLWRSW
jgi:hypothetical protein